MDQGSPPAIERIASRFKTAESFRVFAGAHRGKSAAVSSQPIASDRSGFEGTARANTVNTAEHLRDPGKVPVPGRRRRCRLLGLAETYSHIRAILFPTPTVSRMPGTNPVWRSHSWLMISSCGRLEKRAFFRFLTRYLRTRSSVPDRTRLTGLVLPPGKTIHLESSRPNPL